MPESTAPSISRVRVGDVRDAARKIAQYNLSPAEYAELKNEEVWKVEEYIGKMIKQYRATFARIEPELANLVFSVFEAVKDEADVRRARVDSDAFIEYVFVDDVTGNPVKQGKLHRRWQRTMRKHRYCLIIGPREHGKSTQVVGHALWRLGNNPNLRIKVISNNDKEASKRIVEMQQHIEKNPRFKRVFPNVVPDEGGSWNSERFYIKRDRVMREPSVEGYGVLSGGTGGRADFIILDDVVDRKNALTQPSLRIAVKDAVKTDWLALLADNGSVVAICTLWHKDDLNCDLGGAALKQWLLHNEGKGPVPKQDNLQDGDWFVSFDAVGPNFETVWPEGWPEKRLRERARTIGKSAFNRGWRNRVVDNTETSVDAAWIRYYKKGMLPPRSELFILQSYDLAISLKQGKKKSWFTCCTMAAQFAPQYIKIFILDVFRKKRISFPKQVSLVKQGYAALKPDTIVLEANAYQAALYQQILDTTLIPVVPVISKINKALRLESVTPNLEAGHILFSFRLDPENNENIAERGDLVNELLDFPFGDGDDMVDAFSQGVRFIQEYASTLQMYNGQIEHGEANVYAISALDDLSEIETSLLPNFEA